MASNTHYCLFIGVITKGKEADRYLQFLLQKYDIWVKLWNMYKILWSIFCANQKQIEKKKTLNKYYFAGVEIFVFKNAACVKYCFFYLKKMDLKKIWYLCKKYFSISLFNWMIFNCVLRWITFQPASSYRITYFKLI